MPPRPAEPNFKREKHSAEHVGPGSRMPHDVSAEGFVHKTHTSAKMLVVDDDPRSRKLLEGYLRSEDYSVQSAPDGPQTPTGKPVKA